MTCGSAVVHVFVLCGVSTQPFSVSLPRLNASAEESRLIYATSRSISHPPVGTPALVYSAAAFILHLRLLTSGTLHRKKRQTAEECAAQNRTKYSPLQSMFIPATRNVLSLLVIHSNGSIYPAGFSFVPREAFYFLSREKKGSGFEVVKGL